MQINNCDIPLTSADIAAAEKEVGVRFPVAFCQHYLRWNGGEPEPYVYEDGEAKIDTVVSTILPLVSGRSSQTAVDVYRHLVLKEKLLAPNFFPFAVDGGGDYFYVDCSSDDAAVYYYRGDTAFEDRRLRSLRVGLSEFWSRLTPE